MRFLTIIFIMLLASCKSYPQSSACDTVYRIVDEMPKYKTGYQDLTTDLNKLKINNSCKVETLQEVIWVIDKEGKIVSVEVVGPLTEQCKNYVIQHANTLTEWTPGKKDGKPVCVKVVLTAHIRPTK